MQAAQEAAPGPWLLLAASWGAGLAPRAPPGEGPAAVGGPAAAVWKLLPNGSAQAEPSAGLFSVQSQRMPPPGVTCLSQARTCFSARTLALGRPLREREQQQAGRGPEGSARAGSEGPSHVLVHGTPSALPLTTGSFRKVTEDRGRKRTRVTSEGNLDRGMS